MRGNRAIAFMYWQAAQRALTRGDDFTYLECIGHMGRLGVNWQNPWRFEAIQKVANNWTLRHRYPHITKQARAFNLI